MDSGTVGEPGNQVPFDAALASSDVLSAALINQLFESASDAIWLRDPDGRFQLVNSATAAILGRPQSDVVGRTIDELYEPSVAGMIHAQTEQIFGSREALTVEETAFHHGYQSKRTYLSSKVPLFALDGSRLGILGISRDITDRKEAEDQLRASREQLAQQVDELRALYDSAPLGLAFFDRRHRYVRLNRQLADINGLPVEDHVGRSVHEILGDNGEVIAPFIDRVFETGEASDQMEFSGYSPRQPDILRHWMIGFYPVRGAAGEVVAVGAWIVEISDQKAAEERELLLAREVDHRAKNLLAVVQSIVQLTPDDTPDLKSSILGRIHALARAHSLLSDARWEGVVFGELVRDELAPFVVEDTGRVSFAGPHLLLRPAAAQSLALVLHELATNAAKYGALANSTGKLDVEWKRDNAGDKGVLVIEWRESGSDDPGEPALTGFGSKIIRASVSRQLRGTVTKKWLPDGLHCTICIPAAEVVPGSGS